MRESHGVHGRGIVLNVYNVYFMGTYARVGLSFDAVFDYRWTWIGVAKIVAYLKLFRISSEYT
jgi:hypothetical protein